jgi:hypothetical protein
MSEPITTPETLGLTDGRLLISESQSRDFRVYTAMRAEAVRRHLELEIVPDDIYAEITGQSKPPSPPGGPAYETDADGVHTDDQGKRWYVATPESHADYVEAKRRAAELGAEIWLQ